MPEDDKKTVDLDTSGPGARVELPETENENDKTYENEVKKNEANVVYDDQPDNTPEKSVEQSNVRDEKKEGGEVEQKTSEDGSDQQQATPNCLLYTSPSPRDGLLSRMPSSA